MAMAHFYIQFPNLIHNVKTISAYHSAVNTNKQLLAVLMHHAVKY